MELAPGTEVDGRYVVEEKLGEGGMARVYRVTYNIRVSWEPQKGEESGSVTVAAGDRFAFDCNDVFRAGEVRQ